MPDVAIFHTSGRPIIRFEIKDIYFCDAVALRDYDLLSEEEYNEFIKPHDCIVTVLGSRIETTKGQLTWGDFE